MSKWPFRRKSSVEKNVPKEVQEFYGAERREHLGMAWVVALVSLFVTVLVLAGIFYGGRWTYRKLTAPSKTETAETAEQERAKQEEAKKAADAQKQKESTSTPQAAAGTTNTGNAAQPNPSTTTGGNLPQTGPDSDE